MSRFGLFVYEQPFHTFACGISFPENTEHIRALHITGDMRLLFMTSLPLLFFCGQVRCCQATTVIDPNLIKALKGGVDSGLYKKQPLGDFLWKMKPVLKASFPLSGATRPGWFTRAVAQLSMYKLYKRF